MGRKIILLSDGTGNGAAKRNKTNVWRLYDALDLHQPDQFAFYDDGVGSQEFLPLKLLGGAFGYGLKRNVCQLYKFLCYNYQPGDRIYMFGFSRGAFTIRMLVGMIEHCGICTGVEDDQELERIARQNYNAFRSKFDSGFLTRLIRKKYGVEKPEREGHKPEIEFLGLWDTVDAYGLPIDKLALFWDKLVYPLYFPEYTLWDKVKKACHALSVDDERKTFHPVLWDESKESVGNRIEQVWFPGVHSDVGGGYPEYTMALVTLDWMISKVEASCDPEVEEEGLCFIESRRMEIHCHSDWHGKQHDSRAMFGAYYRYSPREIDKLCNDRQNKIHIRKPKIHRSVFERIAGNVMPYAPIGIPVDYEVIGFDDNTRFCETDDERQKRYAAMSKVKPVVAARKWLHLTMVITTLIYLISPGYKWVPYLRKLQSSYNKGLLDWLLAGIMKILPDFVAPWIQVLRDWPWFLYLLLILFSCFFFLKSRAYRKTQLLANKAWGRLKSKGKCDHDNELS